MADQTQKCGMCQQMRANGISSNDGRAFVCDGCKEDAATFLEIEGSLGAPPEGPEAD